MPIEENKVTVALNSALEWLDLVDNYEYENSWSKAAPYFKNNVTSDKWNQVLTGVRKPLGTIISRELKSEQYTKELPGTPDGEYFIIQYNTVFENKSSALETVTPMLAQNGKWQVAGYFVK